MHKNDSFFFNQLQSIFYRLKPGISASCNTNTILIKISINDFLAHISIFYRKHQYNLQIIVCFQKNLKWYNKEQVCLSAA